MAWRRRVGSAWGLQHTTSHDSICFTYADSKCGSHGQAIHAQRSAWAVMRSACLTCKLQDSIQIHLTLLTALAPPSEARPPPPPVPLRPPRRKKSSGQALAVSVGCGESGSTGVGERLRQSDERRREHTGGVTHGVGGVTKAHQAWRGADLPFSTLAVVLLVCATSLPTGASSTSLPGLPGPGGSSGGAGRTR